MFKLDNLEEYVKDAGVLERGKDYVKKKLVHTITTEKSNNMTYYTATVDSEKDRYSYTVKVSFEENDVVDYKCNCRFANTRMGPICKHVVGVLLKYKKENKPKGKKEKKPKKKTTKAEEKENEKNKNIKPKRSSSKKIVNEEENIEIKEPGFFEKEIECTICYELIKKPVILPCNIHIICYECAKKIYWQKIKGNEKRELICPSCGKNGGSQVFKYLKDLRINKDLEKAINAHEKDKRNWEQEKKEFEKEIELLKDDGGEKQSPIDSIVKKLKKNDFEHLVDLCIEKASKDEKLTLLIKDKLALKESIEKKMETMDLE